MVWNRNDLFGNYGFDWCVFGKGWWERKKLRRRSRRIYQKGKIFVNNNTKGTKKQFSLINGRIQTVRFLLNHNRRERAIEEAKYDLEYIRKYHSERSFYRYKKKIKELGLEV